METKEVVAVVVPTTEAKRTAARRGEHLYNQDAAGTAAATVPKILACLK